MHGVLDATWAVDGSHPIALASTAPPRPAHVATMPLPCCKVSTVRPAPDSARSIMGCGSRAYAPALQGGAYSAVAGAVGALQAAGELGFLWRATVLTGQAREHLSQL
jgi:hypothetical protein